MKRAFGKVFGTLISAMTGMKVEVEPNPAVFVRVSSKVIPRAAILTLGVGDIQNRLRAATRPATKPGLPTATTPKSYGPVRGAAAGRSTTVTPTL